MDLNRNARPWFAWMVVVFALLLLGVALAVFLTGCTMAGYDSETADDWFPNGAQKSHVVKRRVSATNISRDAPAAVNDALDMGADFFTKHASALLGTTLPIIGVGGGLSALGRTKAKRERDNLRRKHEADLAVIRAQHEKDKADEYSAGVLAGKSGGTA